MAWPFSGKSRATAKKPKRQKAQAFGFDASRFSRRLRGWKAERRNINALLTTGGELLRARARQLCRENPYAANALDAFVAAAVGTGIKPSPLYLDADTKAAVMKAFRQWTDEADADGLTDLYGMQALAARAMFEAGECFIRFLPRRSSDGLSVPLQIQLLEAEMLPLAHNETLSNGHVVRSGIEFNQTGQRVAYHFLQSHPGDIVTNWRGLTRSVVPASDVLHLYRPLRPGQVRGQPGITPGMVRLYLLDGYDDAELDRKKTAALFAGFIKKKAGGESPFDGQGREGAQPGDDDQAERGDIVVPELQPGSLFVLEDDQEITFSNPADVGGSYEAFQFRNLCAISVAVGLPYHTVTGDLTKANYGSQRGGQIDLRRRMDQFQHMTLVFQMCRPIWERFMEAAVLAGAVPIRPTDWIRRRADMVGAKHIPPAWPWIDPYKDRQAQALAEDRGWISPSDTIEAEGADPEETDARTAADHVRRARLGLNFAGPSSGASPSSLPLPEDAQGFAQVS